MNEAKRFRLAAIGDVMLARDVGRHYAEAPGDFAMTGVQRILQRFDIVCANLESPVAVRGRPCAGQDPHVTFRAHPQTLKVLKTLGVSVVSLGNNHALDYGESALAETLELLDDAGIKWVGAGRNYTEANQPLLLDVGGRRVAFLSHVFIYSVNTRMATGTRAGVSDHRLPRILGRIRELRRSGYDVVVMSHWGIEYHFYPLPYQMRAARRIIDAGASLILGHGPHYPQGIEDYHDGRIVYSLGNFIFDEPHKYANRSFIFGAEIGDSGVSNGQVFPIHIRRHVPAIVEGPERRRLERLIQTLGTRYPQKNQDFWRRLSISYFTELCGRVIRGRSLKYLLVPTMSFYADVGPLALLRKLKLSSITAMCRSLIQARLAVSSRRA
jgi:poly-gamma-glutamate capsule biosynthesis protein CapA/YwtB (metallophosphatase superfamily)